MSTQHAATAHGAVTPPRPRALKVLVVGTDDWAIEQSAASLQDQSHEPLRCHDPGSPAFPCNALLPGRQCPLDLGAEVVVTSRARPLSVPTLSETGVTCALHAGLPLVVTGISDRGPFGALAARTVPAEGCVVAATEEVAPERRAKEQQSVINLEERVR